MQLCRRRHQVFLPECFFSRTRVIPNVGTVGKVHPFHTPRSLRLLASLLCGVARAGVSLTVQRHTKDTCRRGGSLDFPNSIEC
jgi:hypothetical protein